MKLSDLTLLFGLSFIPTTTTSPTAHNIPPGQNPLCDCYTISGPEPGYFKNRRFWDFRNINLPTPNQTQNQNLLAPGTTLLLTKTPFVNDWRPQIWAKTGTKELLPIANAESNVFIARNPISQSPGALHPTYLLMQTTRLADRVSTAEIEFQASNILHCSLRVSMRIMSKETVLGSGITQPPTRDKNQGKRPLPKAVNPNLVPKGACVGLFTYRSKTCESDIEILTSDPPHTIHYSNQPDYDPISDKVIPGAGSRMNISVPWTAWVTHRLDWFPNISRWYTGEVLQLANSYGVPREPSTLVLNLWSDGGNWTGDLRVGESVFLGVEWIELVFNVSEGVVQPVNRGKGLTRRVGLAGKPLGDIPRRRNETGCRRPCYLNDFH